MKYVFEEKKFLRNFVDPDFFFICFNVPSFRTELPEGTFRNEEIENEAIN